MARLTLDYATGQIHPPFEPMPDDQGIVNDVTVTRRDGSFARAVEDEGPLSVQEPPDGVGRYGTDITVDAFDDDQLQSIASWIKTLGTQDVERYTRVHVNLAANPDLIADAAAVDTQDRLVLQNLPSWMPPDDPDLVIEGYEETISQFSLDITFNTTPGNLYQQVGRWALLSKELHAAVNSSATSIEIANTSLTQPMLATSAADIGSGYGVTIGGEELRLTAVTASTATFGNTGTASTGSSGSRTPGLPTGAASGNLVLIYASTRNSGTGIPDTPSSWTRLPIFPSTANAQVFGRIYDGVWAMPTVTYTGGAANEDTIAQSLRLGGKWHSVSNILVGSAHCLNTSAQNVTYPGLAKPICDDSIILFFAWKQDDYTSATSPGTEVQEASSTAGNDASQVWAYSIQTTATAVASGVFTITGGASAISRGAIAALRCDYQTATVTRSTNGVSASHSAGDAVTMTEPLRWGL